MRTHNNEIDTQSLTDSRGRKYFPVALSVILFAISFLSKEISFAVGLVLLAGIAKSVPWSRVLPLWGATLALSFVAITSGFAHGASPYDILKDLFFFFTLPIYVSIGTACAKRGVELSHFRVMALFSIITASLLIFGALGESGSTLTRQAFRAALGYAAPLSVFTIPLAVGVLRSKIGGQLERVLAIASIFTGVGAAFAADSRTMIIMCVVAATFSLSPLARRVTASAIAAALCLVMFFATPLFSTITGSSYQSSEYLSRYPTIISEWIPYPYTSLREINTHWRAYEGFRAYSQWSASPVLDQVFGQGAGSKVNIGLEMKLGGKKFYAVPTLHNGLAYAITKGGLLALGYICLMIFVLYRLTRERSRSSPYIAALSATAIFYVVLGFPTIGGFFNASNQGAFALVALGLCIGQASTQRNRIHDAPSATD